MPACSSHVPQRDWADSSPVGCVHLEREPPAREECVEARSPGIDLESGVLCTKCRRKNRSMPIGMGRSEEAPRCRNCGRQRGAQWMITRSARISTADRSRRRAGTIESRCLFGPPFPTFGSNQTGGSLMLNPHQDCRVIRSMFQMFFVAALALIGFFSQRDPETARASRPIAAPHRPASLSLATTGRDARQSAFRGHAGGLQ